MKKAASVSGRSSLVVPQTRWECRCRRYHRCLQTEHRLRRRPLAAVEHPVRSRSRIADRKPNHL